MNFEDDSGLNENLQGQGQRQALQTMIQGSVNTYARMLNSALFPFLLYQQSLMMATQIALGSLRGPTGVTPQQGTQVSGRSARRSAEVAEGAMQTDIQAPQQSIAVGGDEIARQSTEATGQAAQDNAETSGRVLQQSVVEAAGQTTQESDLETTDRGLPEVDESTPGPADPVMPPPPEAPNTIDEPPDPETIDEQPTAEAVDEADQGNTETSSLTDGRDDEAASGPSDPVPSPALEEPATAEEPPTRATAAARRRAEEMNVDLAGVEGTGREGRITVNDVRRKAQEGQS